ncbi:MAG: ECF transporter S component [Aigarchaeota archaeon]|nr:ECF transporter S component [Aigarchaeota archaeon]
MKRPSLRAATMALSTALVLAATIVVNIYVPATRGYFNLGETMIYLVALLFDPVTAAFAGGVGSALADIILGYTIYAPATLVIKAAEGALASFLIHSLRDKRRGLFALSMGTVTAYSILILVIGYTLFVGEVELTLPGPLTFRGFIEPASWIIIASALIATPLYILIRRRDEIGLILISLLLAGSVMILGYYVYQQFLLGYYALAEVPINLGQVVMGIAVAIPAYTLIKKYLHRF